MNRSPSGELVFGVGVGRLGPVWADLATLPHLLIGGETGSGKSVFLRQVVTRLVLANPPERLRLGLIDLKGGMELNLFRRLPHRLGPVLREWQDCGSLLEYLNGELDRRQAAFDAAEVVSLAEWNGRHPENILPYLVLVIDETAELTAVEAGDRAERASRQAQLALLIRLCRLGRAVGIHAICATQRPDADAVPGQLKANLPATMAFRVRDAVNSRVLLGDGHPEAASLPPIAGRGIWQAAVQVEVQAPWLGREEAAGLLARAYSVRVSGGTDRVTQCPLPPAGGDPSGAVMPLGAEGTKGSVRTTERSDPARGPHGDGSTEWRESAGPPPGGFGGLPRLGPKTDPSPRKYGGGGPADGASEVGVPCR